MERFRSDVNSNLKEGRICEKEGGGDVRWMWNEKW
jgi:hypothetical protein